MTENRRVLQPLKIRYRGTVHIAYDERYTEYIQPTGLLPFITLVDRWRPETHTFHLRAGEMTPTLQDVSMILGLPIQGEPLCMNTASDGWRQQMGNLIGRDPRRQKIQRKELPPAHLSFGLGISLVLARKGPTVTLSLTVLEHPWSWGTTALAYLYRQLDEACRRTGKGGIGGCLLLLFVWSWDRLSIGRPRVFNERPWPHYPNNPDREPTWAYLWDKVSEMTSDPMVMYRQYTEELDTLTAEQVDWEPYGTFYRIGAAMTDLNPKCTEEAGFWRCGADAEISFRRMRNDEPSSSEEEEQEEQEVQQQEEQRLRTKRMAVRKQPVRRGR
ncbi:hypothetical protein QYE76_063840 [Lolium multiflorum]|uniref:Aminotransferase-like plant mobile domain-containing protein n=1 Tax=Lolium multiflorum TaxID=4521 RepID=A0AAD8S7U1_LOLMU|nr:hypothetical protein QYE76_063840 [Lolium multiflorum]